MILIRITIIPYPENQQIDTVKLWKLEQFDISLTYAKQTKSSKVGRRIELGSTPGLD